ncbi:TDP-N-acetylfucosamine:lipid II N-acetylfucosaminyltransferase [Aequorivita sp. CIP111184]|nr:TDP-N-acetylfucosamine:lipid II N-acetylfucosaminyltransferase [Aequorivita sp. CIP111184]
MRILHITSDEKFINSIYWQFENVFPGSNEFVVFLAKGVKEPKYVSIENNLQIISENSKGLKFCLDQISKFDLIIFHGLMYFQSMVFLKAKNPNKFIWFFWGGELYDNPRANFNNTLGKRTSRTQSPESIKNKVKAAIRPFYYQLKNSSLTPEKSVLKAARQIKYFGVIHEEEVALLQSKHLLSKDVVHIKMSYYPIEFIFKGIEKNIVTHENILVGNSASRTNNHLEAFDILKKMPLKDRKVIAPLNYGDMEYANIIVEEGKNLFGENFQAITTFLPLQEYNKFITKCGIVVMNHYRQQAIGNILAMLWMGAKVYLDEKNTFYHYLKRKQVHVYSIEKDLKLENTQALKKLEADKVAHNRQILTDEISFETLKTDLKNQLTALVHEY